MVALLLIPALTGVAVALAVLLLRERRRAQRRGFELDVARGELAMVGRQDGESGLWNSRQFVESLTREIERSRTYGRPVALALAAIDGLGEEGEDTAVAMRDIGQAIGGGVRALDIACRVGSTEFAVIMCETDSRSAAVAGERILRAIAHVRSPEGRQARASLGIAACPVHGETFDALVERSGSALRSARRAVRREPQRAGTVTVSMAIWDEAESDE